MAVERMEMLNIIGQLEDMDYISKELVLLECMHMVNALHEIDTNNFTISTTEKNMDALVDVCFIKPYHRNPDYVKATEQIESLMEAFELDKEIKSEHLDRDFIFSQTVESVEEIHSKVKDCLEELEDLKQQLSRNSELQQFFGYIEDLDIPWEDLEEMENFYFKIGLFPKENMEKLKDNYNNIPAIVYKVHSLQDSEVVISIAPKSLMVELDRIYTSLSYQSINIPNDFKGTPREIIDSLKEEQRDKEDKVKQCKIEVLRIKKEFGYLVQVSYSRLMVYEKMQEINNETACSNDFFYLAGWIPTSKKSKFEDRLKPIIDRTILYYKDPDEVGKRFIPPTQLKNSPIIRPFEAMVTLYGTPSYKELDPTSFVALSYMLLFGIMFGDVGQGLLFFIAGLFVSKKMLRPNLGGVLSRLGFSSIVFGVLYGSVFGFEGVIPALLVRPMDNINLILISAIVLGVVLLTVAFIYSLLNALKHKDVEEGLLGKNGVAGLLFFWTLLIVGLLYIQNGQLPIPLPVIILILGALLALMVVKQPLANWLMKKRPLYNEPVADYYIEGGFGILETLLSMLSNTISFVRVGAFALNHVGLFIAFQTMSKMMNNRAGSILILIIGNLIIIGLEGLIVFIQGLRLEYYELFSKFYDGSGIPYHPVALDFRRFHRKQNTVKETI